MADCPICGKPAAEQSKPFCSRRCADVDLGRWLKGGYAIPGAPVGPQVTDKEGENDPDDEGA
jgi:endogenous inhibitor of DNA gyrase (YacG/DUF329 family)